MNAKETLKALATLGTAQNRKVYARHGVRPPAFGVSYAHLGQLARKLAGEHEVALELWASGNHDARVLATKIADPARLDARTLLAWGRALDNYVLTDALAGLVARSPAAAAVQAKWLAAKGEWPSSAGWSVLCARLHGGEPVPARELARHLAAIESRISDAPNRTRHAMNGALIAIGVAAPELRAEALAVARRLGTVEVDHGETGCKTPDAASYIAKTLAHRSKAGRKPAKASARPRAKPARR